MTTIVETPTATTQCGRPTRAGTPCKQLPIHLWGEAGNSPCRQHLRDDERAEVQLKERIFQAGRQDEKAMQQRLGGYRSERLEKENEKLRQEAKKLKMIEEIVRTKYTDRRGWQLVTIDGRYGYAWAGGEPLKVGDEVELPGSHWSPSRWTGKVTALGSTYDGEFSTVIRRL